MENFRPLDVVDNCPLICYKYDGTSYILGDRRLLSRKPVKIYTYVLTFVAK
jgi:hypothetical protein